MKKIVSALLALCLMLALSTLFVACAHECEFSTDWSKDATAH